TPAGGTRRTLSGRLSAGPSAKPEMIGEMSRSTTAKRGSMTRFSGRKSLAAKQAHSRRVKETPPGPTSNSVLRSNNFGTNGGVWVLRFWRRYRVTINRPGELVHEYQSIRKNQFDESYTKSL